MYAYICALVKYINLSALFSTFFFMSLTHTHTNTLLLDKGVKGKSFEHLNSDVM
jgi:hypothetical protein